ncbi:MAG: hypothetical protein V3V56_05070, partial [bacterium]
MHRIAAIIIALGLSIIPVVTAIGGGESSNGGTIRGASDLLRVPWNVTEHVLSNGMRALLLQDRRAPSVVLQVWYGVGSRD